MMSDITEYQQVAAIACMDIDILAKVAESDRWTADDLREMIFRLKKQKDLLITDAKVREMRYNATKMIFNVASKK
jgi:hypothetical protein